VRWPRRDPREFEIPGFLHVEKIVESGFSTMYRAYQPQFERWVAIKVLKTHLGSAFERECKTLGRLGEHPRVVRMFHAGTNKSGSPYIVMEWLPGDHSPTG
jgi:serine/threonine protein kinase